MVHPELHVVVGEATRLVMRSEDVIHSLYIPAFRMKMDVVPGRYSKMWFTPTEVGQHHVFCAQSTAARSTRACAPACFVHTAEDYQHWLDEADKEAEKADPVELGKKIYNTRGCATCHSIDGTQAHRPHLQRCVRSRGRASQRRLENHRRRGVHP